MKDKLRELAVKIHDRCCPKCNGLCHCGAFCEFQSESEKDSVWDLGVNAYFLELAGKGMKIMETLGITEDEFLRYAKRSAFGIEIPKKVQQQMQIVNFR